jgi:hypothetical protein
MVLLLGALGSLAGPEDKAPAKERLIKAHETSLSVGTEFHAGTTAALRCAVHSVKSLTETTPLASAVEVRMTDRDGKAHELFKGRTDEKGEAVVELKIPSLPPGNYKMEVATKSAQGEEKLEKDVKVKAEPKVLLVTDKPLYQPGQLIHIRALCLGAFDLKPVSEAKLVFEVEDSKGNKVFKREHTTSAHGVASVDFQLASEVNQGDYRVRAILGEKSADKTVTVKPYVLPKFKSALTADKKFYAPKETIKADLQTDYFFGKPVAGGKVKVTASTFDVAFKDFQTVETKTDEQGHAKVEIKLPDYFVGQPLDKGNALVKLEVKVTDKADHTETITRTYPVSSKPIQVSLLPEAGKLVPGVENRVFVAALYPDGSPATCDVQLWLNKDVKDKFIGKKKTSSAGLAEFNFTPDEKLFRAAGQFQQLNLEVLGGKQQIWAQKLVFDLKVIAADAQGTKVEAVHELTSDPFGTNVMLRLDKAIYQGGDTLTLDVRSSAGMPTAYVDLVRDGQTLLTKWLDVKDGKAKAVVDLPSEVFGTIEVHAYQMLNHGEILRDSRIIYVQPSKELKVNVKADRDVYLPGQEGKIRFEVTDQQGKPTAAALGVIIVDEAVYALQEMQPGLEKVYFTLQEELMKPQAQAVFKPSENVHQLIRRPVLNRGQQQIAQALLAGVQPKPQLAWNVDPAQGRKQKFDQMVSRLGQGLFQTSMHGKPAAVYDAKTKRSRFHGDLLEEVRKQGWVDAAMKNDPLGRALTLAGLTEFDRDFNADNLARAVTNYRMQHVVGFVAQYAQQQKAELLKDGKWTFPENWLTDTAKKHNWAAYWIVDGWGGTMKLVAREKKKDGGHEQFQFNDLVSAGPDGKFGTGDDFRHGDEVAWKYDGNDGSPRRRLLAQAEWHQPRWRGGFGGGGFMDAQGRMHFPPVPPGRGGFGGGGGKPGAAGGGGPGGGGFPVPMAEDKSKSNSNGGGAAAAPVRLREYFPETMLWNPALVTDDKGIATLPVAFADSITTWRLTASASSAGGLLGGTTTPLRVFQDFFVDLDLPLALTKNDEVSFPVAVFNYLKTPQTVKLELIQEPWFELVDGALVRSLDLKPGEVTAIKYRIRAKKVGNFPLTVKAFGSKMSDAIKRSIDVVPDGQMKEQVVTDRLSGKVKQVINIPDNAIPDGSKLMVKVYPGVFSQVLEGVEGLIRLPGG